jgi:hypothetical protein
LGGHGAALRDRDLPRKIQASAREAADAPHFRIIRWSPSVIHLLSTAITDGAFSALSGGDHLYFDHTENALRKTPETPQASVGIVKAVAKLKHTDSGKDNPRFCLSDDFAQYGAAYGNTEPRFVGPFKHIFVPNVADKVEALLTSANDRRHVVRSKWYVYWLAPLLRAAIWNGKFGRIVIWNIEVFETRRQWVRQQHNDAKKSRIISRRFPMIDSSVAEFCLTARNQIFDFKILGRNIRALSGDLGLGGLSELWGFSTDCFLPLDGAKQEKANSTSKYKPDSKSFTASVPSAYAPGNKNTGSDYRQPKFCELSHVLALF